MCLQGWLSTVAKQFGLQENWGGVDKTGQTAGSGVLGCSREDRNIAILLSPLWLKSKDA